MNKRKILLWYDRTLGVLMFTAVGLIIYECLKLCSGQAQFTRQSISCAFGEIRIFLFVVLGSVLLGFVLHRIIPCNEKAFHTAPGRAAKPRRHTNILRITTAALALTMILLGLMNGGLYDIWVKAVRVCSECIGLG